MGNLQVLDTALKTKYLTAEQQGQWNQLVSALRSCRERGMVSFMDETLHDMWEFILALELPPELVRDAEETLNACAGELWNHARFYGIPTKSLLEN